MIMACLKYGQYFSQYDVRDIAVVYPGDQKQSGGHWWVEYYVIFYILHFISHSSMQVLDRTE